MTQVSRIARFSLTTANAPALAAFYEEAFGCIRVSADRQGGAEFENLMGVRGGAERVTLALGGEIIDLLQFDQTGAPYPKGAVASDLCFQHFAIVVPDMAAAWQWLQALPDWSGITRGAPQKLPASSGDVTAFKFRDLEGHPLEFLEFPNGSIPPKWQKASGLCVGIDHTAISVAHTGESVKFYNALGLKTRDNSENRGAAQSALDGLADARVHVTAMTPSTGTPHLELLGYQGTAHRKPVPIQNNDIACTRIIFEAAQERPLALIDPDGHHAIISRSKTPSPSRSAA